MVDLLRVFKFLDNDLVINELKSELPAYLATTEDVAVDVLPLTWWEHNAETLPCWAKACKKVILC